MKIQIKESLLRGLIKESIKKVLKEELNQLHDNGIDHFISNIGKFITQYKNSIDTPRERSAQVNLELQLTTNPDYTTKKIFNEYGIDIKKLASKDFIDKFAFETFPLIVDEYSNFKQKNNINERSDYDSNKMMNNFVNKFGKVGAHLSDFQRFLNNYDSNHDNFNEVNYDLFEIINGLHDGKTHDMKVELANKFGIVPMFNGTGKVYGFNENNYKEIVEKIRNYCNVAQEELNKIQDYEKSIE